MADIIDISGRPASTVSSKIDQVAARQNTVDLAIRDLANTVNGNAQNANFVNSIMIAAFKKLGIDFDKVAEELVAEKQAERTKVEEALKAPVEINTEKEPA